MKEKPILFSTKMVEALLNGSKTQTRRVIKPNDLRPTEIDNFRNGKNLPYQPGDQLWVRETFRIAGWWEGEPYLVEYKDGTRLFEPHSSEDYDEDKYAEYAIQSSEECIDAGAPRDKEGYFHFPDGFELATKWRPSIFMPRWASRITLEVTGVALQQLQDITEEEAFAEGLYVHSQRDGDYYHYDNKAPLHKWFVSPDDAFRFLWDSINEKRGFCWEMNPWVWVVTFKVVFGGKAGAA